MPSSVSTFIDRPGRSQAMVAMPSASMSMVKIAIRSPVARQRLAGKRLKARKLYAQP